MVESGKNLVLQIKDDFTFHKIIYFLTCKPNSSTLNFWTCIFFSYLFRYFLQEYYYSFLLQILPRKEGKL